MAQIQQLMKDLFRHADEVSNCTKPLLHLGITCFYYVHIKNNGDYILLTDRPEVDEYYFDNHLYLKDPYVRHPSNYQPGVFLFEQNNKEQFDESLIYLERNFHISPMLGFCNKQKDSVEFYGFWGESQRNFSSMQAYLQFANLLKTFTDYFRDKCRKLLQSDTVPYLSLGDLIGAEFISNLTRTQDNQTEIHKFLKDIGLGLEITKAESLSDQEKKCIQFLVKGMSAKETANKMHLSCRTVEHYLDNIKNKLACKYKNELFTYGEKLINLGLL